MTRRSVDLREARVFGLSLFEDGNVWVGVLPEGTQPQLKRQAVLPRSVRHWTLTTRREKLIKIGAKVVRHSKKVVFQMAEVAVPRELFRSILQAIDRLRLPAAASG